MVVKDCDATERGTVMKIKKEGSKGTPWVFTDYTIQNRSDYFLSPQGEPMLGICLDCGAGTALIPLSTAETGFIPQIDDGMVDFWYCGYCGSNHVTIRRINFEDVGESEVIYDDFC
jgi:hypothetical protein